ncbi:54S ribosomal protein L25, mitochondrial [Fusarium oxysporum]|nr:54S ribosomal protein L25, mitochondrial [Fusarium oxysporum]
MASTSQFIGLAKSLPAPLQRFFARYPPAAILPRKHPKDPIPGGETEPFPLLQAPSDR